MLSLLVALATMAAGEKTWGLKWQAPAECINAANLSRQVEEKLGRPVFGLSSEFTVDGLLQKKGGAWHASFVVVDSTGQVSGSRRVEKTVSNCRALDASLVLVVTVMIAPDAVLSQPLLTKPQTDTEPEPEIDPNTPLLAIEALPESGETPATARARTFIEFSLLGNGAIGGAPSLLWGGAMAISFLPENLWGGWIRLGFSNAVYQDESGGELVAFNTSVSGWACPIFLKPGDWRAAACFGLDMSFVSWHSMGFEQEVGRVGLRPNLRVGGSLARRLFDVLGLQLAVHTGFTPFVPTATILRPNGTSSTLALGAFADIVFEFGLVFLF